MKQISLILCIFTCLTFHLTYASEELTKECLKKYLSYHEVKEDVLDYVDPFFGSISNCKSAVTQKLENIYDNLKKKLKKSNDKNLKIYAECIMRDIEEEDDYEKFELASLREIAVEMISNWRFWAYFSKESRLDEIRSERQTLEDNLVKKSLLKCKGHTEFGDLFSSINDQSISWQRSNEQEYCIRKILVDIGMLNPKEYQFQTNPKNVRIDNLDCNNVFKGVLDNFYDELKAHTNHFKTDDISDCFIDAYKKNKYAENILKAEVLSKLNLQRAEKSKERQNFINSMVDIMYGAKDC